MIKIDKSPIVPITLRTAPTPGTISEVQESIYKADDVRRQLVTDQHYKCAYCESKLSLQYNDVEHYRPKSHYYWLAHQWDNLLYSCNLCNRTYKKANFPLEDERARVSAPGSVAGEHPMIVNPAGVDPSIHIKFNRYIAVGITPEGRKTIEMLHLDDHDERPDLIDNRKQLFEEYDNAIKFVRINRAILARPGITDDVRDALNECIRLAESSIALMTSRDRAHSGMLLSQNSED